MPRPTHKPEYQRKTDAQKQELRARHATEDVSRKQREAQCLQLRIQGWSFERMRRANTCVCSSKMSVNTSM